MLPFTSAISTSPIFPVLPPLSVTTPVKYMFGDITLSADKSPEISLSPICFTSPSKSVSPTTFKLPVKSILPVAMLSSSITFCNVTGGIAC